MTEPEKTPQGAAPTAAGVGALLRQTRIRRGQSIEVVAQQTRIPKKMLEALEADRFEDFPAVVYLRGFLKSYCDHLDLDFDPLWTQVDPVRKAAAASSAAAVPAGLSPAGAGAPAPQPAPPAPKPNAPEPEAQPSKPAEGPEAALLSMALLAILLMAGGMLWLSRRERPAPPPPPPPPPSAIAPINQPREMKLKLAFRREAWVELHADGALRFQGRAPAGYSRETTAMDAFILNAPEPEALALTLDGKPLTLSAPMKDASGDYKIARP